MGSQAYDGQKRRALNDLALAERAGDLDVDLKPLLDAINSKAEYYTTSSCSGRIALMQDLGGKGEDRFIAKWHGTVGAEEVLEALRPAEGNVWFRYEPPILHVMARTSEAASAFLQGARESGFKRSGIQSLKAGRILVEVVSTERIDAPVMAGGRIIADEGYVRQLAAESSVKYRAGQAKLERLSGKLPP